jgi:signal transduction histidine kinase
LPEAVNEVLRQQRELIRSREVEINVDPGMPRIEVNAPTVELCLSNYLSNAIKYSNPHADRRWVRLSAVVEAMDEREEDCALIVRVQDNGVGVPESARDRLFERFFRSDHTAAAIEGTGLGLSLVKETLEAIGGTAWAEFGDGTTTFAFSVPCRRRNEPTLSERGPGGARPQETSAH